ncbi:citrate synthase [candidate division WOR-3 bacterium]|nr:citrate synthase [candidate division WOR-3 bacterium]
MGKEPSGEFEYSRGLEGVSAAISAMSRIDGDDGILIYRGIPIEIMAENSTFEEATYFLLFGNLPNKKELDDFTTEMKEYRKLTSEEIEWIKNFPKGGHPMDALKTCVSYMGMEEPPPPGEKQTLRGFTKNGKKIIARLPSFVAAFDRARNGKEILQPDNSLPHAANFLYMLHGEKPDEESAKILDLAFILHADHGMNASTFSTYVTSSTLSDIYSSIITGIGTLRGPLHGGANERVVAMLQQIGSPENAEDYIMKAIKEHKKIMGFGHRVYKAYDPRAKILKDYAKNLAGKEESKLVETAIKVEEIMMREVSKKGIFPNVDFYSGFAYKAIGIPTDLFTPIFAVSRVSGWVGHCIEYRQQNRIFRPRAIYNGPIDVEYTPMDERE